MKSQSEYLEVGLIGLFKKQVISHWKYYFFACLCLILTHIIQAQIPFWAKDLADFYEKTRHIETPWYFLVAAIGIFFFRTFSRYLFFYPARILQKSMRTELLTKLESISPFRYENYTKGQLFQLLGNDIDQIRALIGFAFLQIANIIIASSILLPKLMAIHPYLIIALFPMLLSLIIFTVVVSKNRDLYKEMQEIEGNLQNCIIESYLGKETINTFHAEMAFFNSFQETSFKELNNFQKASNRVAITMPLVPLGVGCSLILGAYFIHYLSLGKNSLISFSGVVFLFTSPLMFMIWIGTVYSRSIASWDRLKDLMKQLLKKSHFEIWAEEHNPKNQKDFALNLWGNKETLDFKDSEWHGIIGKTGSGKSKFLLQVAEIFILKGESISYVGQDPYVYSDTLLANIFLGEQYSDDDWERAFTLLKVFRLDDLAENEEKLKNLEVGENGKNLSGGQAKRLNLVRSLFSGRKILVWDDPFSSIDVLLEKEILEELFAKNFFQDKTLILSTHRLTTIKNCRNIIFLEANKGVVERGKIEDLLDKKSGKKTYEYFKDQFL